MGGIVAASNVCLEYPFDQIVHPSDQPGHSQQLELFFVSRCAEIVSLEGLTVEPIRTAEAEHPASTDP